MCGVDLVRSKHGPLVLEVNSSPGIREAEETCKVDVATAIVARAEAIAAAGSEGPGPRARYLPNVKRLARPQNPPVSPSGRASPGQRRSSR